MGDHELTMRPRVVVVPYPGLQGHLGPALGVAQALARHCNGCRVTLLTTKSMMQRDMVQRYHQRHQLLMTNNMDWSTEQKHDTSVEILGMVDDDDVIRSFRSASDSEKLVASIRELLNLTAAALEKLILNNATYKHINDDIHAPQADDSARIAKVNIHCLVCDSYFLAWAHPLAVKWNIPCASLWTNSLTTLACSLSLPRIIDSCAAAGLDPFNPQVYDASDMQRDNQHILEGIIPSIPSLNISNLPFKTMLGALAKHLLNEQINYQLECIPSIHCLLVNSFLEFEEDVYEALKAQVPCKIITIGSLLSNLETCDWSKQHDYVPQNGSLLSSDEEDGSMRWLDTQEPNSVLFVSFGTVFSLTTPQIEELVFGLASARTPFLWALRGPHPLPPVIQELSTLGKIVKWAPQLHVLSHKAVGGFLTHCGWNSTLESLTMGVPMITCPQFLDQYTNSWLVVNKLQLGIQVKCLIRNPIEHAIRQLMQEVKGTILRERASHFRDVAKSSILDNSHTTLRSLFDNLEIKNI